MLFSSFLSLAALGVVLGKISPEQKAQYNLRSDRLDQIDFTRQPYVSNGYIGLRIPGEGFGYQEFDKNVTMGGWPIFESRFTSTMVAGLYATGVITEGNNFPELGLENEPIATLPTISSLYLTVDGETYRVGVKSSDVTNYRQEMSIHDGLVKTSLTWKSFNISYSIFAHRTKANLAVIRLDVQGLAPTSRATVTDILDVCPSPELEIGRCR